MHLEPHSGRRRLLADLRLEHGVGQAFRKLPALRQAEPSGRCGDGNDGQIGTSP